MRSISVFALLVLMFGLAPSIKAQKKFNLYKQKKEMTHYDSTKNFLGSKAKFYKGQELIVRELPAKEQANGYEGFVEDYKKSVTDQSNIYKCCDGKGSKYKKLAGKSFTVKDVIEQSGDYYFLDLGDVYYKYNARKKNQFPFIVKGFKERAEDLYVKNEYYLRGRNWLRAPKKLKDLKSGNEVDYSAGTVWKCVSFEPVEENRNEYSFILQNSKGERIYIDDDKMGEPHFLIEKEAADELKDEVGEAQFNKILKGEVEIGMTKDMCRLALGEPKREDLNSISGQKIDSWTYSKKVLQFKNGKLEKVRDTNFR